LIDELQFEDIYSIPEKRYCFVVYKTIESAEKAMKILGDCPLKAYDNIKLYIKYAEEDDSTNTTTTNNNNTGLSIEPEDCSNTDNIKIPGLYLFTDFIDNGTEEILYEYFSKEDCPWEQTLNRKVQHYGFPFNYRTLMLDYSVDSRPIPTICNVIMDKIVKKVLELGLQKETYNENDDDDDDNNSNSDDISNNTNKQALFQQLTVNQYLPGQGIAPHIDTESCIGPIIPVINLASGITMLMEKRKSNNNDDTDHRVKKHIWLPRRSLLILSGESRYLYSHGIAPRNTDKVNGTLIPRQIRISLTFRQVLHPGDIPKNSLSPSTLEKDHVFEVYDNIAIHWNHTRGKRKVHWHRVKAFIESLPKGSYVADIGCGDGKYFGLNPDIFLLGCDRSTKLLEVSQNDVESPGNTYNSSNHRYETFSCDAVKLPLRSNVFDAALCIAVLHHLSTVDRRIAVLRELLRITRFGGMIMLQAWALEQDETSRRNFEKQDVFVPWNLPKRFNDDGDDRVFQRYCHVYKEGELIDLCSSIPNCKVIDSGWDKGNWFVQLEKVEDNRLLKSGFGLEKSLPTPPLRL
jgi:alkylated DNA repair protein alkB family protein 8